jgi:hypothetical protein
MKDDIKIRLKDIFISQKNSGYLFDIIIKKITTNYPNYRDILMEYIGTYKMNILDLQEYIFNDNVVSIYENKKDLEDVLIDLNKITVSKFEYLLLKDLEKKYNYEKNKIKIEHLVPYDTFVDRQQGTFVDRQQGTFVDRQQDTFDVKKEKEIEYKESVSEDRYNERYIHFMSNDCYKKDKMYNCNISIDNLKSIDLQSIYLKCDMYNINEYNNKFYIVEQNIKTLITLPIGYYTIQNLLECITKFTNLSSINKNKDYVFKIFLNILKNKVCFTVNNVSNVSSNNNNIHTYSVLFIENEYNYSLGDILGFNKKVYTNNSIYIADESPNTNIFEKIYVQIFLNEIPLIKYETTKSNFFYYDILHLNMEKDFGKVVSFSSENNQYDIDQEFNLKKIGFKFNNNCDCNFNLDNLKFEILMRFEFCT